jgi:hypothetical protein
VAKRSGPLPGVMNKLFVVLIIGISHNLFARCNVTEDTGDMLVSPVLVRNVSHKILSCFVPSTVVVGGSTSNSSLLLAFSFCSVSSDN